MHPQTSCLPPSVVRAALSYPELQTLNLCSVVALAAHQTRDQQAEDPQHRGNAQTAHARSGLAGGRWLSEFHLISSLRRTPTRTRTENPAVKSRLLYAIELQGLAIQHGESNPGDDLTKVAIYH